MFIINIVIIIIVNYLAAPRPPLSHWQGDSLTHLMLFTAHFQFWLEDYLESGILILRVDTISHSATFPKVQASCVQDSSEDPSDNSSSFDSGLSYMLWSTIYSVICKLRLRSEQLVLIFQDLYKNSLFHL